MIELHYGFLQPVQKTNFIAGNRIVARNTTAAKKSATPTKLKVIK